MYTIAPMIVNSSNKFGSFTQNSLQVKWMLCDVSTSSRRWVQALITFLRQEGKVHWTQLNNIAINPMTMISNGVSVFCYTFAGESSEVVKFILNTINVILSSKKRNRNVPCELAKCTDVTHLSCFTVFLICPKAILGCNGSCGEVIWINEFVY